MAWQPQEAGLVQLCNLLAASQRGENPAQILQQLDQYQQYPDFNNYLAYIFAVAEQVPVEVRQVAGLSLKNNLRHKYAQTDAALKEYIKGSLLPLLAHRERALRHTAGSCISAAVVATSLAEWPQLVSALQQCMASTDPAALDGGLDTWFKIVEESPFQMEATLSGDASGAAQQRTTAAGLLTPPLLALLKSAPTADTRRQAVAVLNLMARDLPAGILDHIDEYTLSLFALAHDSVAGVRQEVVKGMVQLLTIQPAKLQPYLYQVIEYMLQCNEAGDEGVAMESCEFWLAFCDAQIESELLKPFLPRLIPMLMKNMVFEEHDEEVQEALEAEQAPQGQGDRASELRPMHHKENTAGIPSDPEEGEEDDDDEALGRWNLRRCSAKGLDRLAVLFGDDLLPILMPIVEQRLKEADWRARESAILALGAVAEGCHMGLLPYLNGMIEMLLPKLTDPQPMVRIVSCWALRRYGYWLLAAAQEALAQQRQQANGNAPVGAPQANARTQLGRVIQGLLNSCLDHNKFVQSSACSSIAEICQLAGQEDAAHMLTPYLPSLVQVLATAIKQYGKRNIHLACDALCMLGEAVGPELCNASLAPMFMNPVCDRITACGPSDRELIPLYECAVMACGVLRTDISTWAPVLSQAALRTLTAQCQVMNNDAAHEPGVHACALDTLDGLCEALGAGVEPLIANTALPQLLLASCGHTDPYLRQASYALVGDLAKSALSVLAPVSTQIAQIAIQNLAPENVKKECMRACNNACWSLGELATKLPVDQVLQWGVAAAERMAALLAAGKSQLPGSLIENAAITLGRLAMRAPDALAPHFGLFCAPWCQALRNVRDDIEKEDAFTGLCALVARNPDVVCASPGPGGAFQALAGAIASWRTMRNAELQRQIKQMLEALQARMTSAGTWQSAVGSLDPPTQQRLTQICSV